MMVGELTLQGLGAAGRQIETGNDVNGLVCVAFGSLLTSPFSWTYHWVWAVLALLVVVQSRRYVAAGPAARALNDTRHNPGSPTSVNTFAPGGWRGWGTPDMGVSPRAFCRA